MGRDLLPLFLGTAYACLGLSGLRLLRLDGTGFAWFRLCLAGLAAAALEWYRLYAPLILAPQPNDLPGSLLALASLAGLLEFSRHAVSRRFHLGPVAQTLAGVLIAGLGIATVVIAPGGIYDRLVFVQRSVGLSLAGISLLVVMPYNLPGARYARAAGLVLLLGLAPALALSNLWLLAAGLGGAAILLRTVHTVRHDETRSMFAGWALLELAIILLLLVLATLAANKRGNDMIRLEGLQFLRLTEAAAAALDPESIAQLTGTRGDLGTPQFETVSRRLLSIQQNTHPASRPETSGRYAYLMRLHDGGAIFLADEPHEPELPTAPGDAYDEASPELLEALLTGTPFIEGPLTDRYGTWVSAFAPIHNRSGDLLALLGIDFDAAEWSRIEEGARLTSIRNWTLVIIIALSVFISVGIGLEAQQQLRRSEQMFRTAADYTATWEYWVGSGGEMLHTSPASEAITGYKPAALLHHPRRLLKIVHPEDRHRVADHLRTCSSDAPAAEFDFKIIRKDGAIAWISHSCQSVYDAAGRWNGRRASNRDITSLRQAELTLARQERLQRGCQHALRRLLGREGSKYLKDALDLAAQSGGCSCAAIFQLATDRSLKTVESWPPGTDIGCPVAWESLRTRALPILGVGEVFELLPRETRELQGPMKGAHIAILPLLDRTDLWGIAVFAAPSSRDPWSKAELAALATLASGLAVALRNEGDGANFRS